MDQWLFSTVHSKTKSSTHLLAQLGGVPSRGRTPCRWCSWARSPGGVASSKRKFLDTDAGAEQWYKTIAKLMQGRNSKIPHKLANLVLVLHFLELQTKTNSSYLVDPASSHMLVLKIKPCMSKYKHLYRETANGSLKQLWFIWWFLCYLDNRSNSRANTCTKGRLTKPCIY